MRSSTFLATLQGWLTPEKGDTMNQVVWCVSILLLVSALAILGARYVSPELADPVRIPRWI